jgi:hypothetical protein
MYSEYRGMYIYLFGPNVEDGTDRTHPLFKKLLLAYRPNPSGSQGRTTSQLVETTNGNYMNVRNMFHGAAAIQLYRRAEEALSTILSQTESALKKNRTVADATHKKVNENREMATAMGLSVTATGRTEDQVFYVSARNNPLSSTTVDLKKKTCACGTYQMKGVPCAHACAAILAFGARLSSTSIFAYVHPDRTLEKQLEKLKSGLPYLVASTENLGAGVTAEDVLVPRSEVKSKPGRKRKARVVSRGEQVNGGSSNSNSSSSSTTTSDSSSSSSTNTSTSTISTTSSSSSTSSTSTSSTTSSSNSAGTSVSTSTSTSSSSSSSEGVEVTVAEAKAGRKRTNRMMNSGNSSTGTSSSSSSSSSSSEGVEVTVAEAKADRKRTNRMMNSGNSSTGTSSSSSSSSNNSSTSTVGISNSSVGSNSSSSSSSSSSSVSIAITPELVQQSRQADEHTHTKRAKPNSCSACGRSGHNKAGCPATRK